ncbi:glycosyltransferase family 4 protein [Rhizobium sp. G187]|uniref:glycosyltransferase family 4 protein n=1 Tax=Rhizobium sp. G187 TaxID=3451352 RepID=UPI003EE7279E
MSETLRLWLDGQCLQTASRMRGIGRYVEGLIRGIVDQGQTVDLHVSLNAGMPQEAVAARDFLSRWIKPDNIHVWHGVAEQGEAIEGLTDRRRLSETALAYHVSCIAPDVALSTSPFEGAYDKAVPLLPDEISGVPIASIFYDAIPYRFPDRYLSDNSASQYYRRRLEAFSNFQWNMCISDFAKQELADLIGVDRSVNIGAGVSDHFMNLRPPLAQHQRERNTLLYVGGFDWRKNVPAVIEAIGTLEEAQKNVVRFLVVGDLNVHAEASLKRSWSDLQLPADNLQLIGHVSDDVLLSYYRNVSALIQPSFMEGFGLTALEAILCGTPVIAANAGALPEVIIDKTHLFDPHDRADIARHISHALSMEGKSTLSTEAVDHARQFSWKRTAEITIEALKRIAQRQTGSLSIKEDGVVASKAFRAAKELRLRRDLILGCLARSEIREAGTQRLILDATSTVITDGGSGIQRVVKKICDAMPSGADTAVIVGFSDNSDEWFEVKGRRISIGVEETKRTGERIFFTQRDHILMLDSSWTFHAEHARSLMNARLRGAKVTTCLYDTVPLRASGFSHIGMPPVFSQWLQAALSYSTGFVCISKAVADEFLEILKQIRFPRPLDVGFWPLGADFVPIHEAAPREAVYTTVPGFLMVGTIEPRKGYRVALDAFDKLWKANIDVKLTIVGKKGWNVEHFVRMLQNHPQFDKRLFWRSSATDIELGEEYAAADCLIASSFAEGFGLPIVEAGYFGKPIIASDIPVFREVSAKSVGSSFFEVGNSEALAGCIETYISNPRKQDFKAVKPWENWTQSAEKLRQVVMDGGWYHRYTPEDAAAFVHPAEIGKFEMTDALDPPQSRHALRLIDGPMNADINDAQKYIVEIANQSDALWSSKGAKDRVLGVFLGCRLFDLHGRLLYEGYRTEIPLIIAPKDTVFMPVEVPNDWLKRTDAVVRIEMVQEGVRWWGSPLVLRIEDIARNMACA